ncbi:MAG: hypothetical protein ACRCZS_00520, partial [Chroococcidiopsis sp.]
YERNVETERVKDFTLLVVLVPVHIVLFGGRLLPKIMATLIPNDPLVGECLMSSTLGNVRKRSPCDRGFAIGYFY